jgi:hypothetical protein
MSANETTAAEGFGLSESKIGTALIEIHVFAPPGFRMPMMTFCCGIPVFKACEPGSDSSEHGLPSS